MDNKKMMDELAKMPRMVVETAYIYALNYIKYGENVTEKWLTATQQTSILDKAYRRGYYDALEEARKQERQEEPKIAHGNYECFHCCTRGVIWESDFDFEDFGYEGQGIVHICHCANCGAEIEYRVPIPDEEEEIDNE